MPLELRLNRDGTVRDHWYGRYEVNGTRYCENLKVRIAGTPPPGLKLRQAGDAAFEVSRAKAQSALDRIVETARSERDSVRLVEKLIEIKTGERPQVIPLAGLPDAWERIPRRREPNARYAGQCRATLTRFAEFVAARYPKVTEVVMVRPEAARAFLDAEAARKVSSKTWNDTLKLLRATFQHLLPQGAANPFVGTPTKATETVFRAPFSPEELRAVMEEAKKDPFVRPLLTTAMCTAMRRGDCCLLKWSDVDLDKRFVTVKTSKTGETVDIPIFPVLHDELDAAKTVAGGSPFCFPEQARMYRENPDGITWRVKKVLAEAFKDLRPDRLPTVSAEETRALGEAYLDGLPEGEKTARMRAAFLAYMDGRTSGETKDAAGVARGSVSNYLNEIEAAIGVRVVRGRSDEQSVTALLKTDNKALNAARTDGVRRASIRDFHSFRVTWVTLALTAGMPLEMVQRVTGHKTTDVVLKHYFKPGRDSFRAVLGGWLPQVLTGLPGGVPAEYAELHSLTGKLAEGSATEEDRKRIRALARKV